MRFELGWIVASWTVVSGVLVSGFTTAINTPIFGRLVTLHETASSAVSLETVSANLEKALAACRSDVAKVCKVQVGWTENRLGLIATAPINKGDVMLAIPYDDRFVLSPNLARKEVYKDILPEGYDGWTGDAGLIALLILNEVARADSKGVNKPLRSGPLQEFMEAWVSSLPSPSEMVTLHPYLWLEEDQDILQSSSMNKIYCALDDLKDNATWLTKCIWSKDCMAFPKTVTWNGQQVPCFSSDGFKWAMELCLS